MAVYIHADREAELTSAELNNPVVLWSQPWSAVSASTRWRDEENVEDMSLLTFAYSVGVSGSPALTFTPTVNSCNAMALKIKVNDQSWAGGLRVSQRVNGSNEDIYDFTIDPSDETVILRFPEIDLTESGGDTVELVFVAQSLPTPSTIEIYDIRWGTEIMFNQRIYQGYTPPITPSIIGSRGGDVVPGQVMQSETFTRGSNTSAEITDLKPSTIGGPRDAAGLWSEWQDWFNAGKPFYWAWRPGDYADDVFYTWRDGNALNPTNSGPTDRMTASFGMRMHHE